LKEIQKAAAAKQKTHLEALISAAAITQDKRQKKLIICLKRVEELWQCYAMVCSITKPCQLITCKNPKSKCRTWQTPSMGYHL